MSVISSYLEKIAEDVVPPNTPPTNVPTKVTYRNSKMNTRIPGVLKAMRNDKLLEEMGPEFAKRKVKINRPSNGMFSNAMKYVKNNPYKSGAMAAGGLVGAYGAKKLYDSFSGNQKTAAYEYVLNKVAAITSRDDGRETHTGKVLGGLGIAGLGALANRAGNIATDNADFFQKALDPKTDAATVAAVRKRFADNVKGGDKLDQATLDKVRNVAKRVKHVGKGAMGLGALLGGYGAYKNYQGSKNDPINMPSDATIRRHMKG